MNPPAKLPAPAIGTRAWPDYRAVWRWHFYASLFCIPFVIILSITGGIYLFKPQIEAWSERGFENLQIIGCTTRPAAEQIEAALAAVPGSTLKEYELPRNTTSAPRVIVRDEQGDAIRVYVHPVSLAVLHTFPENDRFSRLIFRIHGELLMGDRGSMLVELAASWTIIMILTGLYLWWPRNSTSWGGILYPRLCSGSRTFWKDLHSVTGTWISAFALFLLVSGLPWAKSWGNYLKAARKLTNTAVAKQEWSNTSEAPAKKRDSGGEHSGHGGGRKRDAGPMLSRAELEAVDRIWVTVYQLNLAHPVVISPPASGSKNWSVKSMTANRPYRESLVVDETGKVLSREGFREKHVIDQLVSIGIAAHEGQLFGWPNQLLGLFTALGLILICVSGLILWWKRRDQGVLGAPKAMLSPRVSISLLALIVALGIYLPLFGATLIAVLLIEWLILRRIPPIRNWLGLNPPSQIATGAGLLLLTMFVTGCGGPQPITGGTPGVLRAGGDALAEVQVTVHQLEAGAMKPIGFAVTGTDGTFQLVTNKARAALRLLPGEYRFTLESAGSPARIPPALTKAETTTLQRKWTSGDVTLDLDVPYRVLP
jgi:uncharacterized iron-regulated membrane protein